MNTYHSRTLDNGLRIVHLPLNSNISYSGFIINTGTRDEESSEYGMAHFVEHMLFKGTRKRKSYHIINRMESVGGELNAYTTKEETVIYSAFLEEYVERAFELLTDLTFNSTFPDKEIEKEVDVILDEINSYEDSPSELIYDEFENIVFKDSQLGHNILGEESILETFDSSKTKKFIKKHYQPDNIVFFSAGKTDFKKIIKLSQKYLSIYEGKNINTKRIKPLTENNNQIEKDKETTQSHVILGGKCCDMHNYKRSSLQLFNNILGGMGMNSRLNISLREKRGYVYNVESNTSLYTDTGLMSIYFGCDKKNTDKCLNLIYKEIDILKNKRLSSLQLSNSKKQLIGQISISADNHENLALALGKSYLHYNHFDSIDEIISKIKNITSSEIMDWANNIFTDQNISLLKYV